MAQEGLPPSNTGTEHEAALERLRYRDCPWFSSLEHPGSVDAAKSPTGGHTIAKKANETPTVIKMGSSWLLNDFKMDPGWATMVLKSTRKVRLYPGVHKLAPKDAPLYKKWIQLLTNLEAGGPLS